MPENLISMAGFDLTFEVKPADYFPPTRGIHDEIAVQADAPEAFERVLARAEKSSQPASGTDRQAARSENEPALSTDPDTEPVNQNQDTTTREPEEDSAETPAGTVSVTSSTNENLVTRGASVHDSGSTGTSVNPNNVVEPGVVIRSSADALILQLIGDIQASDVVTITGTVSDQIAALTALNEQGILISKIPVPEIPLLQGNLADVEANAPLVPGDRHPVNLPVTGVPEQVIRPPDLQFRELYNPIVEISGNGSREPVQPDPIRFIGQQAETARPDPVRVTETAEVRPEHVPRSEWRDVLELDRLLRPTYRRDNSFNSRSTEHPSIEDRPGRPGTAPEAQVDPSRSRNGERVIERQTVRPVDQNLWLKDGNPKLVNYRPLIQESAASLLKLVSQPVEVAPQVVPAGTTAETVSATQVSRAAATVNASVSRLQIDPELLVSDVRSVLMRIASDGSGEVRLILHPPELGELVVRLESAKNGVVRAEFHTVSPLVRDALEAGLSKLTEALKSEGLTLGQAEVHLDFNLGAGGNSGETDLETAGGNPHADNTDADSFSDQRIESAAFVERLPEGATISILA